MPYNSKVEKREMRTLTGMMYNVDLSAALDKLYSQFQSWKAGEIDCFELNEEIHKYHNGISRELYKYYAMGSNEGLTVAAGLLDGKITAEDLSPAIREKMLRKAEYLKQTREMLEDHARGEE